MKPSAIMENLTVFKAKLIALNTLMIIGFSLTLFCATNARAQTSIQFEMPLVINNAVSGNINAMVTDITRAGETTTNEDQISVWLGQEGEPSPNNSETRGSIGISANVSGSEQNNDENPIKNDSSTISLYTLRQRGLKINFDSAQLSINSSIPRLGTQNLSVRGRKTPVPSDSYAQAKISSGLNLSLRNDFNHRSSGVTQNGFGNTNINLNGFTSIGGFGGWSLFYEADYLQGDDQELARGDTTLIHDNYNTGVRYSVGDVRPNSLNQQSSADLLGFSIERNYEQINPLRNLRPSGRNSFTLDRPARVSFEVNGRIVDSRQLEAGEYSAQDFPLTVGANNIRVLVDDGSSNVEIANFSAFSNLSLLAPGLTNFGVNVGVLRDSSSVRNRVYTNELVALGSYERGINQKLTLGAQAEISENNALLGSTAVYGTRHGVLGIDVALSKREGFDDAISTSLSYSGEFEFGSDWRARADLQLDYQSNDFGGVVTEGTVGSRTAILGSFGLSKGGYNFSLNANSTDNSGLITNTFSTGISKSFSYFDLSLDYRYSKTDGSDSLENLSINLSKRLGRSRVRGQYQSSSEQYRLDWNGPTIIEAGHGSLNRAVLIDRPEVIQAQLDASYTGERFIFDADHSESRAQTDTGNDASVTSFSAATSLGFADGKFAFGRPFNDGFLIVSPHQNLRGKKVSVRRSNVDGSLITATKNLSTTLVPLNSSYREQRYHFEVDDLPLGYDIGSGELDVFPGFLAGYKYQVGSDSSYTVIGNVLWPDNTAPSLIVGKIVSVDGGEPITIFTNKTGRFVAERMTHGDYNIIFNNGYDDFIASVTIEARDEPGLVQLATLTLQKVTQ